MKLYKISQNVNYNPPIDPMNLMADFYLLSTINSYVKLNENISLQIKESLLHSVEESTEILINHLKEKVLNDVFLSICCEARHITNNDVYDPSTYKPLIADIEYNLGPENNQMDTFRKIRDELDVLGIKYISKNSTQITIELETLSRCISTYAILKIIDENDGNKEFVMNKLYEIFNDEYGWNDILFGGKNWAEICIGWMKLNRAKSVDEKIMAIDHIYDLQHNSGSVLAKLNSYLRKDSHAWIESFLDYKYALQTLWGIYDLSSSTCKRMTAPIIRKIENTSYEKFSNGEIENVLPDGERSAAIAQSVANNLIGGEYIPLEKSIKNDVLESCRYFHSVGKKDGELEQKLLDCFNGDSDELANRNYCKDEILSFILDYAIKINKRCEILEPAIATDFSIAFKYSHYVLKGRFPLLEEKLINDEFSDTSIINYTYDIVKGRFPEVEPIIFNSNYAWALTSYLNIDGIEEFIPEAANALARLALKTGRDGFSLLYRYVIGFFPDKTNDANYFIKLLISNGMNKKIATNMVNSFLDPYPIARPDPIVETVNDDFEIIEEDEFEVDEVA